MVKNVLSTVWHCGQSRVGLARLFGRFVILSWVLIAVTSTGVGLAAGERAGGSLLGVEAIEEPLPFFDGSAPQDGWVAHEFEPLRVLLSRSRYWTQDVHLDVVIQLAATAEELANTRVVGRIVGDRGNSLLDFEIRPPAPAFAIYPRIPASLQGGGSAVLEVRWYRGDTFLESHMSPFRVEVAAVDAPPSGRVAIAVPNAGGIVEQAIPIMVGIPFPRGVLADVANLRLVDGVSGMEIPVQVNEVARWSKYGPVKWVHCAFSVDLPGTGRELYLEYGPDVAARQAPEPMIRKPLGEEFPVVHAGRLKFADGLWFDVHGDGSSYEQVLKSEALHGAFVEHENGRNFVMESSGDYVIEEAGSELITLRRQGWFRESGGDSEFCQYVVRYIIQRDSPIVRIFYTWIFTGDGNRERIRNMGWRFNLADGFRGDGFLSAFGDQGSWQDGSSLLQYAYDTYELKDNAGAFEEFGDGRAPGVARARSEQVMLYFGAKDFWQSYPSELEFADGALWFHNWPRSNRAESYSYDEYVLEQDELHRNIVRARFAHEGAVLDFRLPDVLAEDPIWSRVSRGRPASSYWLQYEPESANAQGIARTEEMWLYVAPAQSDVDNATAVLQGLDDESLRGVVDPVWVAASGAFYEMHQQDWQQFPEEERIFEMVTLAPGAWKEHLEAYGMWIYGDMPIWGGISRNPLLYRAFRKAHHGWPYSWVPYARSGDNRLLKAARIATRQMTDANYCHFVDDAVQQSVGPQQQRRVGFWARGTLPWVGRSSGPNNRTYESNVDYLLHAWYLTSYGRAWDVFLSWAEQVKVDPASLPAGPRGSSATLKAFIETYEATFDPWFLAAAHATAESHTNLLARRGTYGHFWQTGDREYLRFTGSEDFETVYMAYANLFGNPRLGGGSWGQIGAPIVESQVFAWQLTGDEFYRSRAAHFVDWVKMAVYDGDQPAHRRGMYMFGHQPAIFTGWALDYYPTALWAVAQSDQPAVAIGAAMRMSPSRHTGDPLIVMRKEPGRAVPVRLAVNVVGNRGASSLAAYTVYAPDGSVWRSGEWQQPRTHEFEIPADAPAGDYRLQIEGNTAVDIPVSDVGTKEVLVTKHGEILPGFYRENRLWFYVPENTKSFDLTCEMTNNSYGSFRTTVWDPNGNPVWNYVDTLIDGEPVHAKIEVPPGQDGQLWHVSFPGSGRRGPDFGEKIPKVFAADKDRWFMPQDGHGGHGIQTNTD